jgi:uncharacterized caspase-like protein
MKARRFIILIYLFLLLGLIPSTLESREKTYKWLDCFVPLGRVVTDVSTGSPRVVEVDIPATVAEAPEVKLMISTEIPRSHDSSILSLQAAGRLNLNGRVYRFPIGNKIDLPLERDALKTGLNLLRFESDSISARWSYDILGLEFSIEGTGGRPAGAAAAGPPSQKQPAASSKEAPIVLPGDAHQWKDYRQAFKTKIGISNRRPQSVQIELPEAVIDSDEVQLVVSTSAFGAFSYNCRVQLYINAQPLAPFPTGPHLRLNIDQGLLKTGLNTLRFETTWDQVDIYELELRLPDVLAHAPSSSQAPLREEDKVPQASHLLKLPERPAADPPADAKSDGARPLSVPPETTDPHPAAPVPAGDPGQRWAVVIGVSSYEDSRIPSLRYASRDAQAFHHWLVSPGGGRFAPSKTRLLVDRDATNERIKDALFNWLKQALEEDVVVIFFAGHGSPESPNAPQNLYLLPHNSKYDNIAVTGFPMWDIETALKRFIRAKRVVIIADACHAAGVGQAFDVTLRADRGLLVNQINSGLQSLTEISEGVCVISASRDREFSAEGREWGGGHGVFSYYLIEGLKGSADFDQSGSVSVGEITVYVSQQVRRATRNAQNPIVAGRFDPSLTIAK